MRESCACASRLQHSTVPFRSIRHVTGHRGLCRSKFPVVSQVTKTAVGGVKRAPNFRRADARPNRSKVAVGHTARPAPSNLSVVRTRSPVTGPVELIEMVQYTQTGPRDTEAAANERMKWCTKCERDVRAGGPVRS